MAQKLTTGNIKFKNDFYDKESDDYEEVQFNNDFFAPLAFPLRSLRLKKQKENP